MSDLRLILLIFGGLFIIGLYCWEIFFNPGQKKKNDFLDAIDDIPDLPSIGRNHAEDFSDFSNPIINIDNIIGQSSSKTTTVGQDAPIDKAKPSIPISPQDKSDVNTASMSPTGIDEAMSSDDSIFAEANLDLFPKDTRDAGPTAIEVKRSINGDQRLGQSSNDLIVLYITSSGQTLFDGLSISKAADAAGMVYGPMNIFHYFWPDKLHSEQRLFSMANMFEPGSFDLSRMPDLETRGLALFMYLPVTFIEPKAGFELFLNTAQRIAKILGGELRAPDSRILSSAVIQSLRLKAESLSCQP